MMECANRKKKSNRRKPEMGLDVVPRNVKKEAPIAEFGKNEEENNMATLTLVGKEKH